MRNSIQNKDIRRKRNNSGAQKLWNIKLSSSNRAHTRAFVIEKSILISSSPYSQEYLPFVLYWPIIPSTIEVYYVYFHCSFTSVSPLLNYFTQ
jgi:hypothetical protein